MNEKNKLTSEKDIVFYDTLSNSKLTKNIKQIKVGHQDYNLHSIYMITAIFQTKNSKVFKVSLPTYLQTL